MLIEVVWVPCIEVKGASPRHACYFAHLVHLLVVMMMVVMLVMVMVMVEIQDDDSPLYNCVDSCLSHPLSLNLKPKYLWN